jgi:hypothetical protein
LTPFNPFPWPIGLELRSFKSGRVYFQTLLLYKNKNKIKMGENKKDEEEERMKI